MQKNQPNFDGQNSLFQLYEKLFSDNTLLYWNVVMFFLDLDCLPLYVLVIQYFCQWLHYDNLWKIRTLKEHGHAELWKTTLKYKNLFSLTSKILGSYMWVFTVWGTGNFENGESLKWEIFKSRNL